VTSLEKVLLAKNYVSFNTVISESNFTYRQGRHKGEGLRGLKRPL